MYRNKKIKTSPVIRDKIYFENVTKHKMTQEYWKIPQNTHMKKWRKKYKLWTKLLNTWQKPIKIQINHKITT